MIICADYHPSTCDCSDEFECRFARNTRRYMYNKCFNDFSTASKLYGSDVCPLKKKAEPSYVSNEHVESIETNAIECSSEVLGLLDKLVDELKNAPLVKLVDELKKAQDDVITKILNAYGLNVEYVKQHPEKFTLQEMTLPDLNSHITHYKLSYNDKAIGEWKIRTSTDFDKNFVKSELTYSIL